MDSVIARCDIDDSAIADFAVNGQNVLRDRQVNERLPIILAGWNESLITRPASIGGGKWSEKDCLEILTIWVVLRLDQH